MNRNLFGALGLIVGILGFAASVVIYYKTQQYVEPVFLVEPSRSQILSADTIGDAPISVIKANGEKIENDLTSVRYYFWNNGTESIRKANILKPIQLHFENDNIEILDFKIVKLSREITGVKVTRSESNPLTSLDVDFTILEPNDGFTGQILFSGTKDASIAISGIIEKSPEIVTNAGLVDQRFWVVYLKKFVIVLFVIVIFFGSIGFLGILDYYIERTQSEVLMKGLKYLSNGATGLIFIFMTAVIVNMLLVAPINNAKQEAEKSIASMAPIEILPNK